MQSNQRHTIHDTFIAHLHRNLPMYICLNLQQHQGIKLSRQTCFTTCFLRERDSRAYLIGHRDLEGSLTSVPHPGTSPCTACGSYVVAGGQGRRRRRVHTYVVTQARRPLANGFEWIQDSQNHLHHNHLVRLYIRQTESRGEGTQ